MIARIGLLLASVLIIFAVASPTAFAYNPFSGVDCSSTQDASSAVCSSSKSGADPISGKNGIILNVTKIVAIASGAAAVISILVGSLRMIIANGDPGAFAKGRTTVIYSLIGLAVVILATTIVGFFVSKL